eukprot:GHRR01014699.1.p1 GENE.GHRR01014699.1~~GHRR01014699.1.p1  ORF type:complete len:604 (+),score=164.45 GHRR01014699.1:196-2007(+)
MKSLCFQGAVLLLLLCTSHVLGQEDVQTSISATVSGHKTDASATVTNTYRAPDNSDSTESDSMVDSLKSRIDDALSGMHQKMAGLLKQAGVTPETLASYTDPMKASVSNMLSSLEAVSEAHKETLRGYFGLLLDNTKELRKTLEDGNSVIDTIRTVRGAECTDPSFDPPTANPARITGVAATLAITSGSCTLTRTAAPLSVNITLDCVEPGLAYTYQAPRYTSRFVSAAAASTEECTVTRKYGVESTTTITLFDPASFYASASDESSSDDSGSDDAESDSEDSSDDSSGDSAEDSSGDSAEDSGDSSESGDSESSSNSADSAEPSAQAASGPANGALFNKGAAWYKTMFPLKGTDTGKKAQFMPKGLSDMVAKVIKEVTVDMSLKYTPFTLKSDLQNAAESITAVLAQKYETKVQIYKEYKEAAQDWMDPEYRMKMADELSFKGHLEEKMGAMNMSSMFDGIFAKAMAKVAAKSNLGSTPLGNGGLAAATLPAFGQLTAEKPLRTLLMKARQGAGQPVSIKLNAQLDQMQDVAAGLTDSLKNMMGGGALSSLGNLMTGKTGSAATGTGGSAAAKAGGAGGLLGGGKLKQWAAEKLNGAGAKLG